MIITFNSSLGKLHTSFTKVCYWGFILLFHLKHFHLFNFSWLSVFYEVHKITTSHNLEGVVVFKRWTLLFNSTLALVVSQTLYFSEQPIIFLIDPETEVLSVSKGEDISTETQVDQKLDFQAVAFKSMQIYIDYKQKPH